MCLDRVLSRGGVIAKRTVKGRFTNLLIHAFLLIGP